jgi:hypothetical protein
MKWIAVTDSLKIDPIHKYVIERNNELAVLYRKNKK